MKKTIVIGGGAAGIAAACRLAERGKKALLLERSPRLGGRAASFVHRRMAEEIDYGQHILMRCCRQTTDLLARLGVREAVSFQPHLRVPIVCGNDQTTLASRPLPGPLHLLPSMLGYRLLTFGERLEVARAATALLLRPPLGTRSFGEWLRDHHQGARSVERLWEPICVATLNAHADQVSVAAAAKVFKDGFFTPHGAELGLFTRPLSGIFAAAVPYLQARGGEVRFKARVSKILIEHERATGVLLSDGEQLEASGIIAAVPPFDLLALLPHEVAAAPPFAAAIRLRWSPIVNLHLWYDRPVMEEPFLIAVDSPVQAIFDVGRIRGRAEPTHLVLSQSAAQEWIGLPNEAIRDRLLAALGKTLPAVRTARLLDSLVIRHPHATFLPTPGSEMLRPGSATPISGLLLSGDYTATGWPSTLEGAVRSGTIAAELACRISSHAA